MIPSSKMTLEQQLETLKKVTIFSGFTDADLQYVCCNCTVLEASKKEQIIIEGSEASEILILLSGHVMIVLNLHILESVMGGVEKKKMKVFYKKKWFEILHEGM